MPEDLVNSLKGDNSRSNPSRERDRISVYSVRYVVESKFPGRMSARLAR